MPRSPRYISYLIQPNAACSEWSESSVRGEMLGVDGEGGYGVAGRNCHRLAKPASSGRERLRGLLVRRLNNLDVGVGVENAFNDLPVLRAYLKSVEPELVVLGMGEPGAPGSSAGRNHPHDQHAPAHWVGSDRVFPSDAMR